MILSSTLQLTILTVAITATITWLVQNTLNAFATGGRKFRQKQREKEITLTNTINSVNKDLDLLKEGSKNSQRYNMLQLYNDCANKGYRDDEETKTFDYMYDNYKNLGGNSFIDDKHAAFHNLPDEITYKKNRGPKNERK